MMDMTNQQRLHHVYDAISDVADLKERLFILSAKRMIVPSIQDSAEMRKILERLYELTGDQIFKFK
jgi:GTP-dependent phosphoenolpyruvate carboxykinase